MSAAEWWQWVALITKVEPHERREAEAEAERQRQQARNGF